MLAFRARFSHCACVPRPFWRLSWPSKCSERIVIRPGDPKKGPLLSSPITIWSENRPSAQTRGPKMAILHALHRARRLHGTWVYYQGGLGGVKVLRGGEWAARCTGDGGEGRCCGKFGLTHTRYYATHNRLRFFFSSNLFCFI